MAKAPRRALMAVGLAIAVPMTLRMERVSLNRHVSSASNSDRTSETAARGMKAALVVARPDPRTLRLQHFLDSLRCPVSTLAEEFVHAADDNRLDWRLLPSISVIESGGGKAYKNNNIFGWANGDYLFPTVRTAIHQVAFKLGKSSLYRDRDVEGKLHLYNPDEAYAAKVMDVMSRISPVANLRTVSNVHRKAATDLTYSRD